MEKSKSHLSSFLLFCVSVFVSLLAVELILRGFGREPWSYVGLKPNEPKMHRQDPLLGWRSVKGSYIQAPYVPQGKEIKVTIDEDGRRATGSQQNGDQEELIFVGGSYVQGAAISDNETLAWKLQETYPSLRVLNYGTGGYGTYQSLLALEEILENKTTPLLVLYGFQVNHEDRNVASTRWFRMMSRHSKRGHMYLPYVSINEQGDLTRHPPEKYDEWPLSKHLVLADAIQEQYLKTKDRSRFRQRRLITKELLLEMNSLCQKNNTKFAVIVFSGDPDVRTDYLDFAEKNKIDIIDCTHPLVPGFEVPGEGHPNGEMNSLWLDCVVDSDLVADAIKGSLTSNGQN